MKNHITKVYSTPIQLKLPVDLQRIIKINDPVYSFSEVMAHICYPSNYPRLEFSDYLGNNRQNQWEQMTNRSIICGSKVVLFAVKKLASDAAVTSTRDSRRNPSLWLFLVGQEASGAVLSIGDMDWLWIRTI